MLKKITLINFMSHQNTVIEPAEGLTVIAGENNCGKSAIVTAIQCVCFHATGNYMVRHGEKECRVIVETDDGHVVEWKRTNRKVSYVVNGEAIDRTQGKVPDKVKQALRMSKVKAENEEFDVHFADQKKPVFLLDGTAGQRAAFFASSSDAAKLIEMQSLHKNKLGDAQRQVKEKQRRENTLLGRIEKLKPLESIESEIAIADRESAEIRKSDQLIQKLDDIVSEIRLAQHQSSHYSELTRCLNGVGEKPDFAEATPLQEMLQQLRLATIEKNYNGHSLGALQGLPDLPKQSDSGNLEQLMDELKEIQRRLQENGGAVQVLELPAVPDVETEKSRIDKANQWSSAIAELNSEIRLLEQTLDQIPKLESVEPDPRSESLAKQIVAQSHAQAEFDELGKELKRVVELSESAHDELHRALEESGTCPTCGQELNLSRSSV